MTRRRRAHRWMPFGALGAVLSACTCTPSAGGTRILWNHNNGIVFAGVGVDTGATSRGIPHIIAANITRGSSLVAAADAAADRGRDLGDIGRFAKWARVEIAMPGPDSVGAGTPNPFAIPVDVTFRGPGGRTYTAPGFYDGDGRGGLDGNVWKVRFAADATGTWRFTWRSAESRLDGYTGSFTVVDPSDDAPDFYRWGRLEYTGTPENGIRYLQFRDGPFWLKAGCDDPENFLGAYRNYDTHAKRAAAIDYLAERGVNSFYMMTHNLDGDDRDVWPWLGKTAAEAKANGGPDARFDVARLAEWVDLFEHMQRQGVVCYIVLEDDSAWTGYDYRRYYRELIARFGHLPALVFNFCEEHNERHKLPEALGYMKLLEEIDPYDHPRGIHNVNNPSAEYVDAEQVDFTSIQTSGGDPLKHNKLAVDWLNLCRTRGRRSLVLNFDEGRPEQDRKAWWSAYMAGGVWEAHVLKPYDQPLSAWEPVWTELGGTRAFMESLPFWEMEASNSLVTSGTAFCLAKPGAAYALYLPSGGTVAVELAEGVN
ncbi:MAG: DUF5060 domain-containing protein, partial [Armatimonadota bacterium]